MERKSVLVLIWFATFIVLVKNETNTTSAQKQIPKANDSKFSLHEDVTSMPEAVTKCNQLGRNLASIENVGEWEELVQLMYDNGYANKDVKDGRLFWTAGTNLKNPDDATYYWLNSGNPLPTVLYAEGQPDGAKFHCIQIINNDNPSHLGYYGFALFNTGCDYKFFGYVCETRPCSP